MCHPVFWTVINEKKCELNLSFPTENAAFEREESDLQVVGIDDRNLNGGLVGDSNGGIAGGSPRIKLNGPNVCTQQEP